MTRPQADKLTRLTAAQRREMRRIAAQVEAALAVSGRLAGKEVAS